MFSKPNVHGLVAVDQNWNICYGNDNKSIVDHPSIPKHVKKIDRALLRNFLKNDYTLFVVGENTKKQMGSLLDMSPTLVSGPTTTNLVSSAFTIAFERGFHNICVLGGRSVYNAFAEHYDSITVHQIQLEEQLDGKRIFYKDVVESPLLWKNKIFEGENGQNSIFEMVFPE